jgi:hypothetical protein
MVTDVNRKIFEIDLGFAIYKDYRIKSNYLQGTGTRNLVALSDGTIAVDTNAPRKYLEFISVPIDAGNSTSYAGFTNSELGLNNVNLIDKVKNIKAYVIPNGESRLSSVQVSGEEIDNDIIYISTNTPLVEGDRVKLYIEYID